MSLHSSGGVQTAPAESFATAPAYPSSAYYNGSSGPLQRSNDDTYEMCSRHNRRRPRRQLVEVGANPSGGVVLECSPTHPCRDKLVPGVAQRRPREQPDSVMQTRPGVRTGASGNVFPSNNTTELYNAMGSLQSSSSVTIASGKESAQITLTESYPKQNASQARQVLCVRHAKVRFVDECQEIDSNIYVCVEHSDCLRSGPVDDIETVRRRLLSGSELLSSDATGNRAGGTCVTEPYNVVALMCSLHAYPRTLNHLKRDPTATGFVCFFPHQCRQRSQHSPKYHVVDPSLELPVD